MYHSMLGGNYKFVCLVITHKSKVKSTPPTLDGKKRLTPGYPALTATIVNLPIPVITYTTAFISLTWSATRPLSRQTASRSWCDWRPTTPTTGGLSPRCHGRAAYWPAAAADRPGRGAGRLSRRRSGTARRSP